MTRFSTKSIKKPKKKTTCVGYSSDTQIPTPLPTLPRRFPHPSERDLAHNPKNCQLTYYDIYGFVLAVDEPLRKAFDLEYWRFKVKNPKKVDLFVKQTDKKNLPVKRWHDTKGLYIPFGRNENSVLYEKGVNGDWAIKQLIEPLISWEDKCFLHCGAVGKDGSAILFPAESAVGKTAMTTFLVGKGYEYLSDEWLIVGKNGNAYPLFRTIHMFDYNLKDKELAKRVLGKRRLWYKTIFFVLDVIPKIVNHRFVRIVCETLKPKFSVDVRVLHPDAKVGRITPIRRVYWLKKEKKTKKALLKRSNYSELSDKMPYITRLERNEFYTHYLGWAYSHGMNEDIEDRIGKDKKIMESAFKDTEVYEIYVPDKIDPEEVYELIRQVKRCVDGAGVT